MGFHIAALQALSDALTFRASQARRLFTKEDSRFFHAHKILGLTVLAHFAFRIWKWVINGSMGLDASNTTLALYAAHALLHVTSFQFHVPDRRNLKYNVIWPEMRWHTMIFAYRSIAVLIMHWFFSAYACDYVYSVDDHNYIRAGIVAFRGVLVLVTMQAADAITLYYRKKQQNQQHESPKDSMQHSTSMTMRANPYPAYVSSGFAAAHNLFYSVSQVLATMNVLTSPSIDKVFLILLPIQTAPFCMTLVKKGVITQAGWHFYYTLALLSNYMLALKPVSASINSCDASAGLMLHRSVFVSLAVLFVIGRFGFKYDKYSLWSGIIAVCVYLSISQ